MEMLLTGDPISAREAKESGLVNRVVPAAELEATARELAERVAAASNFVVGIGKQAFYRQLEMPQPQAYFYAREVMSLNAMAADAQEGMCAFLDKRPAKWENR
jgi:enoyl-CoA hydratase/carnithine racemase